MILGLRGAGDWQDKTNILSAKYLLTFQLYVEQKKALVYNKLKCYDGRFVDWDVVLKVVSESFNI